MVSLTNLPTPQDGHVRVLRVESTNPYKNTFGAGRDAGLLDHWAYLPTPWEDMLDEVSVSRVFGCNKPYVCGTLEHQFSEWFPDGIIADMPAAGLRILALDVPDDLVILGDKQVIFHRERAVEVAVLLEAGGTNGQ